MREFLAFITAIQFSDVIDIVAVTALVFLVLVILRGTRSPAAMRGMLGVVLLALLVYMGAQALHLTATSLLFERFWVVIVLIFLIVFQNEFRKAFTDIGQLRVFRRFFSHGGAHIDDLLQAVRIFSRQKTGALICIE